MKIKNIKFLLIISFCILTSSSSISLAQPNPTTAPDSTLGSDVPKSTLGGNVPKSTLGGNVPKSTLGGNVTVESSIFTLKNPLKVDSIGELIQSFIQIFTYLVIMFAVLMFIWIGFQYVVNASQGNAKKIEELNKQLMWLIAGVAIVIGARVLIQVVINTLSATGAIDPGIINSANDAVQGR
jgi:cytochrome bd-type quinol oxidase subunit 2